MNQCEDLQITNAEFENAMKMIRIALMTIDDYRL